MFKLDFKTDEWYTPAYAVTPILKYIRPNSKIWCPFDTVDSEFVKILSQNGHFVRYTHIDEGGDFFDLEPDNDCQYIISNPPFGKLTAVIERLLQFDLPFAMLCSLGYAFDNRKKFNLLKDKEISLLSLYPRVEFINGNPEIQKTRIMWQSAYLCYKFEKMKPLEFAYLNKTNSKNVDTQIEIITDKDISSENSVGIIADNQILLKKSLGINIDKKISAKNSSGIIADKEKHVMSQGEIDQLLDEFKNKLGVKNNRLLINALATEIHHQREKIDALEKQISELSSEHKQLSERYLKLVDLLVKKLDR